MQLWEEERMKEDDKKIQKRTKRVARIQGGLKVKADCFAYDKYECDCTVMTELICMNRNCSFYKPKEKK